MVGRPRRSDVVTRNEVAELDPEVLRSEAAKKVDDRYNIPQGQKIKRQRKTIRMTKDQVLIQARRAISDLYGEDVGKDWDPIVDLCVIGANPAQDPAIRIAALSRAAPFFHAPAKPVIEDDSKPRNIDTEQLMRRVAQQLLGSDDAARDRISGREEPEAVYTEGELEDDDE